MRYECSVGCVAAVACGRVGWGVPVGCVFGEVQRAVELHHAARCSLHESLRVFQGDRWRLLATWHVPAAGARGSTCTPQCHAVTKRPQKVHLAGGGDDVLCEALLGGGEEFAHGVRQRQLAGGGLRGEARGVGGAR